MAKSNKSTDTPTNRGNGRKDRPSKQKRRAQRELMFRDGKPTGIDKKEAKLLVSGHTAD
jgi:hypothetical protein